jgi:DNA-binding MarR family transcriptional regulator
MPLHFVHPIQRATHRIALYLNQLREQQLTQGEAHILALLADSSPATIADLHRGLAHKRSTLTSILDRLAERKLITRTAGESDRRTFIVALTKKGQELANRISRHLSNLESRVRRKVKPGDIQGFITVLSAIESEVASKPAGGR